MLTTIKKLAKRSKGMEALQAVILLGAAFVVTWGLMTVWGEVKNDVKDTTSNTVKGGGKDGK
jgi:hypothetical protein